MQAILDEAEVVGQDLHRVDVRAGVLGHPREQLAGGVVGLAARDAVGDRQDGGAHEAT